MGVFSFPKSERLYKRNAIQELFSKGSYFYLYPFRVYFLASSERSHEVLFSVSKRNFKKAVHRNLIKRRMREAFRLNKSAIPGTRHFQLAYIYTAKELLPQAQLTEKILLSFKKLPNENQS